MSQSPSYTSYLLGYLPPIVGIFFNSIDLLRAVGRQPALVARAEEQSRVLTAPERQQGVVNNVRHAEALLAELHLTPPSSPRTPEDYHGWSRALFDLVGKAAR